jgi:hypothetical protein
MENKIGGFIMSKIITVLALLFIISGCKENTPEEQQQAETKAVENSPAKAPLQHVDGTPYLVNTVPGTIIKLNALLDKKIMLLGYTLSPQSVIPGGVVTVTWYWKCLKTPTGEWEFFTHLLDEDEISVGSLNSNGQMRSRFKPQMWKPGQIIKDIEQIKVPANLKSEVLDIRTGLWNGPNRMHVVEGPVDEEDRIKGPVIDIITPRKNRVINNVEIETVTVPFAKTPVNINKGVTDKAWENALVLKPFTDTVTGAPVAENTEVKLLFDKNYLYIAMTADDNQLESTFTESTMDLWKEDAFDFFIAPSGEKNSYFEYQISPAGIVYSAFYPDYRVKEESWKSKIKVSVSLNGTINDDTPDTGWSLVAAVPLKELEKAGVEPVKNGTLIYVNFYRIDKNGEKTAYTGWSPPLKGDFHAVDKFGKLVLE